MTPPQIQFAADGMLQSLGAWLRLMGYDCACLPGQPSRALLELAVAEDRILLTRNTHLRDCLPRLLLARAQLLFVLADQLPAQLREVTRRFDLEPYAFAFSRCVRCNQPLRQLGRPPPALPALVAALHTQYWQCDRCQQFYWRGSHVAQSLARLRRWLA